MGIIKCAFLFLAVWLTIVNTLRACYKQKLPTINIFYQAIGITGFIVLQFNLL